MPNRERVTIFFNEDFKPLYFYFFSITHFLRNQPKQFSIILFACSQLHLFIGDEAFLGTSNADIAKSLRTRTVITVVRHAYQLPRFIELNNYALSLQSLKTTPILCLLTVITVVRNSVLYQCREFFIYISNLPYLITAITVIRFSKVLIFFQKTLDWVLSLLPLEFFISMKEWAIIIAGKFLNSARYGDSQIRKYCLKLRSFSYQLRNNCVIECIRLIKYAFHMRVSMFLQGIVNLLLLFILDYLTVCRFIGGFNGYYP